MRVMLIGNPNAGKSSLFASLTGHCAKTANHAGVTVQQQKADCCLPCGQKIEFVDLPGIYSLHAYSEEEQVTLNVIPGLTRDPEKNWTPGQAQGDIQLLFVLDATQLKRNLYLLTELLDTGYKPLVALTQIDLAHKQGIAINTSLLSERLAVPVIAVSSKTREGIEDLKRTLTRFQQAEISLSQEERVLPAERYAHIDQLLDGVYTQQSPKTWNPDAVLLHPFWGLVALASIFGSVFLSLFTLGKPLADLLERLFEQIGLRLLTALGNYPLLASLLVDGVIAGVGTLVAFVPLIALLFLLLGILEESGYLARATFLLDRVMSKAGLSGRAFVPMLSGFACAIPAILSTRVIRSKQNRLIAMLVIPFLSCSARLPLYALFIAAFFPAWQGAVLLLSLYVLSILAALSFGYVLKRFWFKTRPDELILEMPQYRMPRISSLKKSIYQQVSSFIKQAGTLILSMSVLMWALFHFPQGSGIEGSYAGQLGHILEPLIRPLGFDWKIGIGLLASFSAREVMVSTLGVIYGLDTNWAFVYTPLVAISLLVFFALAMQCTSTLVVMRRETQTWRWPLFQFVTMTSVAWTASLIIFQVGSALGF